MQLLFSVEWQQSMCVYAPWAQYSIRTLAATPCTPHIGNGDSDRTAALRLFIYHTIIGYTPNVHV